MLNSTLPENRLHPCFFSEAKGAYGRIHLPVASGCNIQCSYCRRDYDCVHENRPGVTKEVITPEEAVARFEQALDEMPFLSVAGIAGPGDAFHDPETTLKTFELIRKKNPEIALCVSTNGLNIVEYIQGLKELDVRFVTITINTIDPLIGAMIYKWIDYEKTRLYGKDGAELLINNQLEAITLLKKNNFTVKINSVVIPGVNEDHIPFLAKRVGMMGADLMNMIPLIPVKGTDMEGIPSPGKDIMHRLRKAAGAFMPQMHHCTRCRSDAAGLLGSLNPHIS
ncbi:MAG: radical SAM protein [Desulfatiglans sp.]|jgi:nitrogen fixation protein NifB|nr:radical SAM protein [Desulfatiglans sp.]